jgi:hypothetical protein
MYCEHEGLVSAWVGAFESDDELTQYTEYECDEDGECWSVCATETGIEDLDGDAVEGNFIGSYPANLDVALDGHSYVASFRDSLAATLRQRELRNWNTILLIYYCAYDPVHARPSAECRLSYIGTFPYQRDR